MAGKRTKQHHRLKYAIASFISASATTVLNVIALAILKMGLQGLFLENSLQPPLKAPFPKPENREKFWRDFRTQPFGYIAKEYGGIGLKNNTKVFLKKVKRKIKRLVVKGGKRDSRTI